MKCLTFLSLLLPFIGPLDAQERPFLQTPKFVPVNQRTNVCDRQKQLYDNTTELRAALWGLNLTVAMTNYKVPNEDKLFTLVDGKIKEKDPGLFVVVMDELARRAGFTWRNSFAAIDPIDPSVDGNKTWSDLLEWEVNNFDIAADYWGRTEARIARGISFPTGWYDGSVILATSMELEDDTGFTSLWGFLEPFDVQVWIAIIGAIVFTGLMYFVLERLNSNADERGLEENPMSCVVFSALTFTGHYEFKPKTYPTRILGVSWTFWALIMSSAYTANLASFLVSRNEIVFPISTVEDAIRRGAPICVQKSAVLDDILSTKHPELRLVRKQTEQEIFEALKKDWFGARGGCAAGATQLFTFQIYQRQQATNFDCSLTSEKRVYLALPSGFATAVDSGTMCTSLVKYVLDLHLTEMKADGFIGQAWKDHLERVSQVNCPAGGSAGPVETENFSLGLTEMGGIFLCHLFLTVIALCVALSQYFHAKKTRPKGSLRPVFQKSNIQQSNTSFQAAIRAVADEDSQSETGSVPTSVPVWVHDNSQNSSVRNRFDQNGRGNGELPQFDANQSYNNEDDGRETSQNEDVAPQHAPGSSDNVEDDTSMEAHEKFFLGCA